MNKVDENLLVLFQTLHSQQTEIMTLTAHMLTLESIAVRLAGDDVKQQIAQESQELLNSTTFDSHRRVIEELEKVIVGLLPVSDAKN